MKYLLLLVTLVSFSYNGVGQNKSDLLEVSTQNNTYVEKMLKISSPLTLDSKSFYLDEQWNHIMILTKTNEVLHTTGRINLARMYAEIIVNRHVRRLNENKVKALIVNGSTLIKVGSDKIEDRNISSFMDVLSVGKLTLLEAYKIGFKVEEHAYSGVVRDEIAFLSSDFYYTEDFDVFIPVNGKRDILRIMADKRTEVENFIKVNKLKLHQRKNLSALFDYYNSLVDVP